jgi:methionyl-tRNA formyltransferase
MLPVHRGAHPIFWAALFSDPVGVSLHTLSKRVGKGMILHQEKIEYTEEDTFRDIHKRTRIATIKALSIVLNGYLDHSLQACRPCCDNNWYHINSFSDNMLQRLPLGWDSTVVEAKRRLEQDIEEYRKVIEYKTLTKECRQVMNRSD